MHKPHDLPRGRMLKQRFRYISNGSTGWQVIGGSAHLQTTDLTGALLSGESTAEDGRHDFVCEGCGNKLDRRGTNLVARLDQARESGDKVLYLDQLQR